MVGGRKIRFQERHSLSYHPPPANVAIIQPYEKNQLFPPPTTYNRESASEANA